MKAKNNNKKSQIFFYSFILILVIIVSLGINYFSKIEKNGGSNNNENISSSVNVEENNSISMFRCKEGMATVIEASNDKVILIDAGTNDNQLLVDYLNGRTIDAAIITSWDDPHVAGLKNILTSCKINNMYLPQDGDIVSMQNQGINAKHPIQNEEVDVGDARIVFADVQYNNLVPIYIHGNDSVMFQSNQTCEQTKSMLLNNQNIEDLNLSGIVLAGNGSSSYFCEDIGRLKPKFVVANTTLIDQTNNKIDQYVREHNIDFYNFTYSETIPLHFSSSGSGIEFIGFE